MAEYIDREAAINALDALCDRACVYSKKQRAVMCGACALGGAFDVIEELLATDVAPVRHGRWEWDEHKGCYYCSECGSVSPWKDQDGEDCDCPNYCPNCGARMDGAE